MGNERGFSLVEIMIGTVIMGIMMLAMVTMQSSQMKANNYLQFQLKRTELQGAIIGQILNDANNCACLFKGANTFLASAAASAPGVTLSGVAPTQIGRFPNPAPVCGLPIQPLINTTGIDGVQMTSVQLTKITGAGTTFSGTLSVDLHSTKDVLGPRNLPINIPVSIAATTAGLNVSFISCSMNGVAASTAQTWQVFYPPVGRVSGVTYTNTTGHQISIFTAIDLNNALNIKVNGLTILSYPAVNAPLSPSFIVPIGATYSITAPDFSGTGGIGIWSEFR